IGEVIAPPESAFECVPEMVPAAVRSVATSVCKLERELMLVLDTELAATADAPDHDLATSGNGGIA
ncbi:MAG: hypothetical protein ACRDO8_07895, partial [Nocardioidaceae bacterium]